MTNFKRIKDMTKSEMARFLSHIVEDRDNFPWTTWFDTSYCKNCEPIEKNGHEFAPCECNNECKYFPEDGESYLDDEIIIRRWLEEKDTIDLMED